MSSTSSKSVDASVDTAAPRADVVVGDEVFFNHPSGPLAGKVVAHGAHGATLRTGDITHKIKWPHILGHKKRNTQAYQIADTGEDGHLVTDAAGRRRYLAIPNEAREDPLVVKADKPGGPFSGRPGLQKKVVTEKTGKQNTHWVRTSADQPKGRRPAMDESAGADQGYGTHHFESGSKIKFKLGALEGEGTVVGEPGKDGAHVEDSSGHVHKVKWAQVTGRSGVAQSKKAGAAPDDEPAIPADKFNAADFAKQHDQADASEDSILSQFPDDTRAKIAGAQDRLKSIEQTIDEHKREGEYSSERQSVHNKIYTDLMSPDKIMAATPASGDKPTFTILGGRGGSGKSAFKGKVYDPGKAIVLDADEIKSKLPEYAGWNAHQVNEESGDILETIMTVARGMGLNVVVDATMKTGASAMAKVHSFKASGYRVEAHYMHLPRQEAAKRAVGRFIGGGESGRYVPVNAVLANKDNEASFDEVRQHADKWSFHDNNVPQGTPPKLIARSEEKLTKSLQKPIVILCRRLSNR
jgi:predicted ABC-type ATPase